MARPSRSRGAAGAQGGDVDGAIGAVAALPCGAEIAAALDEVSGAVERLRETQRGGVERLRIALPRLTTVAPDITAASPRPFFTTDHFATATRRLIAHKKLNGTTGGEA